MWTGYLYDTLFCCRNRLLAIDRIDLPIFMRIPATALFVFIVSWCIVALFYKVLPKAAKWIMG